MGCCWYEVEILLLLIADWQTVRFISKQIEAVDIGW